MGAPGKSVVIEGGKRGVLLGGKSAVYNAEETCPACCIEFSRSWSFTDTGFTRRRPGRGLSRLRQPRRRAQGHFICAPSGAALTHSYAK